MIPTIKPVSKEEFPFRRLLRSERPARAVFTNIASHTNENDLVALQYRNTLLSVEDINVLTMAQEDSQSGHYTSSPNDQIYGDQIYAALSDDANQISFGFIDNQRAALPVATQPVGTLLSEDA